MAGQILSPDEIVWRALTKRDRPLWRRLSAQTLAQAEVRAPDGTLYWVRVERNALINLSGSDIVNMVAENVRALGETGWTIKVLRPSVYRSPLEMFRQVVHAQAIVVDIAFVIVDAIRRGDRLWTDSQATSRVPCT